MQITQLQQMLEEAKLRPKKRLVVAYVNDLHTLEAVNEATSLGIVSATLTGDEQKIKSLCADNNIDHTQFEIIHEPNEMEAGLKCCDMINQNHGNIIMKGTITSDNYMRCILNKERGIMKGKAILTHVSVIEPTGYGRLLIVGDVAVIPLPDIEQKIQIVKHLINTAHCLGNSMPKVGLLSATEKVSYKIPSCADAALIAKMAERGDIKGAIVDGPLAMDGMIDRESCEIKGLKGPVAGNADCILFPNIESGNVFYKTCTKLLGSELAANVVGAKVPAILSSRGDSSLTKLYSIALAALTSNN